MIIQQQLIMELWLIKSFQLQVNQGIFLLSMVSQDTRNKFLIKANLFNNMVNQVIKIRRPFRDKQYKDIHKDISQ